MHVVRIKLPDNYLTTLTSSREINRIPWDVVYIIPVDSIKSIGCMFKTALVIRPNTVLIDAIEKAMTYGRREPNSVRLNVEDLELIRPGLKNKTHVLVVPTYIQDERIQYLYSRYARKCKNINIPDILGKFDLVHDGEIHSVCAFCAQSPNLLTGECMPGTTECIQTFKL
jgi:hypothetical protein